MKNWGLFIGGRIVVGIFLSVLIFSTVGTTQVAAQQQPYTFTDTQGNKVEAKIRSVSKGVAQLDLANGQTVPCQIAMLIPEDQKYIEDWFVKEKLIGGRYFDVELDRNKTTVGRDDSGVFNETEREAKYKVSIRSKASIDLHDVVIKYKIFLRKDSSHRTSANDRPFEEGEHKQEAWPALEEIQFDTLALSLRETQIDSGWIVIGGPPRTKEQLGGLWLRIYKGDQMIGEFASPTYLMQNFEWDNDTP